MGALMAVFAEEAPPAVQVRSTKVCLVAYGFGDESGNGFGSSFSTPTDDKALVEFWVHPPIRDIPCVIQVKTGDYDFDEPDGHVADLDPDTYSVPESSDHDRNAKGGLSRMFVVGANSALSASTKHYYRIMCGGDAYPQVDDTDPSFTTLGTLAGTTSITVSYNRSGSQTLEYGTAYSRATDTISAGGADVQSCKATPMPSGTSCRRRRSPSSEKERK